MGGTGSNKREKVGQLRKRKEKTGSLFCSSESFERENKEKAWVEWNKEGRGREHGKSLFFMPISQ